MALRRAAPRSAPHSPKRPVSLSQSVTSLCSRADEDPLRHRIRCLRGTPADLEERTEVENVAGGGASFTVRLPA